MYRGEIQNDSIGGSLHRSLAFSPSNSGGGGNDRYESRNLSVGAPLRGAGIGRCEEDEYNCCGLYGRGDDGNDSSSSDGEGGAVPTNPELYEKAKAIVNKSYPKHSAYRSGAYVKKYKEMGGEYRDDGERKLERWFKEDWKDVGNKDYPTYRPTKRISKDTPLTADEIDPQNLSEQVNRKQKIRGEKNLPPFRARGKGKPFTNKQLTQIILDKNKVIADLEENAYGEGFWDDVRKGLVKYNEKKKSTPITEEEWKKQMEDFQAPTENWGMDEGGNAPKAEPKAPSGVAAAAEALKPVREAVQKGIGDFIYGKEEDPRKQKRGLLGISEEGKEESKKKVAKNIVAPLAKVAMETKQGLEDIWDSAFNQDALKARNAERRKKTFTKIEQEQGVFRDKDGTVVKKPMGWIAGELGENKGNVYLNIPYVLIPNPVKAAGLKPSARELAEAGIQLWENGNTWIKGNQSRTLKEIQEDDKIWVPEEDVKDIYGKMRQFVADKQDEGVMEGFEDEGWTKGQMKAFAKIDPRTLKGQDLIDYKESKLALDRATTQNAREKVEKDIKDEEAKANPDKARLAKMREAQGRVSKREQDLLERGRQDFKDMTMFAEMEKRKSDAEYYARQRADAQQADADANEEFKALSPAERSLQLEQYRKELQEQGFTDEQIEEQIGAVGGAGSDDEEEEEQEIVEVKLSKMERYFVDAPPKNEKGERVGLPLGPYKKAIQGIMGIGRRRVYDPETEEEIGKLSDPMWKKVAMKVIQMEKGWRDANLKKLGYAMDDGDSDASSLASEGSRGGGAKPVEMKQGDYYKEHKNIVKLLKDTGKSLLSEANDQQEEASTMAKKMGAPDPFDDELVGEGAIEFTLAKAGKALFNPTGDMTKAGIQTFTPDYDAYGETVEQGRKNAFNLSRSMYNQATAIEVDGFELVEDDTSLRFYLKDDEDVILVGIRGTDVKSYTDLYTWAVIGAKQDFRMTTRFQDDLQKLLAFQRQYSPRDYYYVATGSSLAGSIADRFLDMGLIDEAITYNPSIEKNYILDGDIHNHRVYLDTDPLFILMGQYAPNVEIRNNAGKANFYNPSKEKDYLIASHSIYPVYNAAFEGGGMMGAGKTYTLEEWKAIFDAKLEQKRQQIEAREAKKKQTAKAKRERAKARRDARDEPPPLETPAVFRTSRTMKATPPKEPEPAPKPKAPRKPRLKVVASVSARDEPPPLEAPFRTSRVMKATPPIVKRTRAQRERDAEIERLKGVIKDAQAEARRIDEFLKGFEGLTPAGRAAIKSNEEDRREAWSRERRAQSELNTLRGQEADELKAQVEAEKVAKFMRENDGRKPLVREEISSREDEDEMRKRLGVTKYKFGTNFYYVEDPRNERDMNLGFYKSRQVLQEYDYRGGRVLIYIGRLGEEKQPFQGLMKQVIKAEFPSEKVYRETMGLEAPPKKPKAPASARVELRQELVAEQPRKPEGEFASEAEPLQLVVSEIAKQPQGAFMKLMKSPKLTEADRRLFMRLKETKMTPKMRAILLARSGLARKLMELLGIDESVFQTQRARARIADTTEMRVKSETAREVDAQGWKDIIKEWKRVAVIDIDRALKRTGYEGAERAVKSAKDKLKDISEWCIGSVECLRDAMITDWQGAWTINQEGRMVDADGDKFYSRGKVGTDVWKNKTPLLTIKDTVKTANDTEQESYAVRTYNLVIGEKGQAIILDAGGGDGFRTAGEYDKWRIPMTTLYGFFPLMGLPIPTCKKQGRAGMMKLEIDWKEMPLVRSYKSLTAKAKEEIQEQLRSEYAPKLTAFIDMARSKLKDCVKQAIKGRVKNTDDGKWRPLSKRYDSLSWQPEE